MDPEPMEILPMGSPSCREHPHPRPAQMGTRPPDRAEVQTPCPETPYLGFRPVYFIWLPPDPLFWPWGSATVKLDHFFPDVIILNTLGYGLCLDLMGEDRSRLWTGLRSSSECASMP